jgi:hypothetical protein
MSDKRQTKLVHEGQYVAEVEVEFTEPNGGWGPYLSVADAQKLDEVRLALRSGDIAAAGKLGRVYRLMPITP